LTCFFELSKKTCKTENKESFDEQTRTLQGWKDGLAGPNKWLDFEMIGKVVVSVEKRCKNHGNNKDGRSETSSFRAWHRRDTGTNESDQLFGQG
jgi:hypothetical protein